MTPINKIEKKHILSSGQIIDILKPSEILVHSSNYIQYIDKAEKFSECQIDYKTCKWYQFRSEGRADNPKEVFINWIN